MKTKITLLFLAITTASLLMAFVNSSPEDLQSRAKAENKLIAVYFSGSDWCSSCHQFKKKVLDTRLTDSLLQNHFVYYNADFPQRKKLQKEVTATNEQIAEKLNKDGIFPLLIIADTEWNIKAMIRGTAKAEEAISSLQKYQSK